MLNEINKLFLNTYYGGEAIELDDTKIKKKKKSPCPQRTQREKRQIESSVVDSLIAEAQQNVMGKRPILWGRERGVGSRQPLLMTSNHGLARSEEEDMA